MVGKWVPPLLSTFIRRINQIGGFFASLEHKAFYPSDIVAYRLKYFFFTKGQFTKLNTLKLEYQNAVVIRLYALWARLTDINSYFRKMLDAIAGTNINHANVLAKNWCSCSNFDVREVTDKDFLQSFYKKIEFDAAKSLLNECWYSVLRALQWCLENQLQSTQSISEGDYSEISSHCGEQFATSLGIIFRDHRLTCKLKNSANYGTRKKIADQLKQTLSIYLEKINSQKNGEILTGRQADKLISLTYNFIHKRKLSVEFLSAFKRELSLNLYESLVNGCKLQTDFDNELAGKIKDWIIKVIEIAESGIEKMSVYEKPLYSFNDLATPDSNALAGNSPKVSRFKGSYNLLQPKGLAQKEIISAENIFLLDRKAIKPVAMHILYILYSFPQYTATAGDLLDHLSRYGYDYNSEILPVLQSMVRIDRRLIFCEVNDYEYGMHKIIEESSEVVKK